MSVQISGMPSALDIPAAPAGLPEDVANRWHEIYRDALTSAIHKEMESKPTQHDFTHARQAAHAAACVLLETPELHSYAEAMALDQWHFILRTPSTDGELLNVVTRHGDKYTFIIPPSAPSGIPAADASRWQGAYLRVMGERLKGRRAETDSTSHDFYLAKTAARDAANKTLEKRENGQ